MTLALALVGAFYLAAAWLVGWHLRRLAHLLPGGFPAHQLGELAIVALAPAALAALLLAVLLVPAGMKQRAADRAMRYGLRRFGAAFLPGFPTGVPRRPGNE